MPKYDPRIVISSRDLYDPPVTCERAPGGSEPETLDEWEWQADAHGAEELNGLDQADELPSSTVDSGAQADTPRRHTQPADAGIDWADIERRVSEITPDVMLHAVEQERHDPERLWTRGEALTWYADERHKPQARKERTATQREQDAARIRAKWARMVEAGQHGQLRKELAVLRNTVKARPASHIWADWRISELHAIVAQLPEPAPRQHKPLPLADLPAFLTGEVSAMLPARSQAPTALSPPQALIGNLYDLRAARAAGGD